MSFTLRNLSVLAYTNGFTLWHYKAASMPVGTVMAPGYFANAADLMAEGDMVMISGADGGKITTVSRTDKMIRVNDVLASEAG